MKHFDQGLWWLGSFCCLLIIQCGHISLQSRLTHEELDMHWGILSTVATYALVLKHQAISIHHADEIVLVSDQFDSKI